MKILTVADEECPALWDYYQPGRLDEYDLILACGDLKARYLEFLVTMGHAPLLYVHGNHDASYLSKPPEGCDCIDDQLVVYNGVRILGLGGCLRYHEGPFQYTEAQMQRRIAKLRLALWRSHGVDIVIAHAPVRGLGDQSDAAHRGFESFRQLIERWHPAYFIHGHVHLRYDHTLPRTHSYEGTTIVNATERYVVELPDREPARPRDKNQILWKTRYRNAGDGWDSFSLY